jgi:asparagine synthase (glutamine-hydrolysing)
MGRDPKPHDLVTLYQLGYHLRTLLHRNDSLGMAASIEARFPFLDTRLVRLAVNMPYSVKVRPSPTALERGHLFLRDKWVLRVIAERYLPPALAKRPKRGFPIGAAARMRIAPELFDNSFVSNLFELGTSEIRVLFEQATQPLRLRLLHLDVWGRVCLEGAPLQDERMRLQKYVSL